MTLKRRSSDAQNNFYDADKARGRYYNDQGTSNYIGYEFKAADALKTGSKTILLSRFLPTGSFSAADPNLSSC